ncbi:MAG: hypothetical protein JW987_09740 [Anaerolineaceae bacterium]|nr:hypothetical protein [Anaerolineaceae bacterium]
MRAYLNIAIKSAWITFSLMLTLLLITGSSFLPPLNKFGQVQALVRDNVFAYDDWMIDALALKVDYATLSIPRYLSIDQQRQVVLDHLDIIRQINRVSYEITILYSDPNISDPVTASAERQAELEQLLAREKQSGPVAEAVFQQQMQFILNEAGLTTLGQTLPPVLYRITPLPYALIISPRDVIRQDANVSLTPGLTLEERIEIENHVAQSLGDSTLVEPIGGVGVYPTMVMSTTDINWLAEVVAHEWTHNFLTLRPLGIRYDLTPELRTINETTATIAGEELGQAFIARFYPEYLPLPPEPEPEQDEDPVEGSPEPPRFDFRAEMHTTRVRADELLAEGKIEEAEAYMETRRQFFWENGYLIRKLNQAYFAFHGAYNASSSSGGAAGQDPVGPAVQSLRAQSDSLAQFLRRISKVTSFEMLQKMID